MAKSKMTYSKFKTLERSPLYINDVLLPSLTNEIHYIKCEYCPELHGKHSP